MIFQEMYAVKKDMTEGESQCKMYHPIYSHRRSRELSTASLIGTIKECIWLIFTMLSFSLERFFWCYNLFTTSKAIVVVNFRFCQKFLSDLELRTKCDSYLAQVNNSRFSSSVLYSNICWRAAQVGNYFGGKTTTL